MVVTLRSFVFFLSIVHLTGGIGSTTFQLVPNGIKVSIPVQGYERSAIHFNINKQLNGIEAGDHTHDFFGYDIKSGDHWEFTFPVAAKQGDVINYWIWGEKNSQGETLTNQKITLGPMLGMSTTTTVPPTTTIPSTTISSTTPIPSTTTVTSTTTVPPTTTNAPTTTPLTTSTMTPFIPGSNITTILGNPNSTVLIGGTNTSYSTPSVSSSNTTVIPNSNSSNNNSSGHSAFGNSTHSSNHMSGNSSHGHITGSSNSTSGSISNSSSNNITSSVQNGTGTANGLNGGSLNKGSCCNKDYTCQNYPCLIFDDEFDILNHCVWEHEITAGGNGTLTSDHYGESFLTSGTLDLWGGFNDDECTSNAYSGCKRTGSVVHPINPIQSARLRSKRGFSFKYGKVEVEAKMPKGDWIWPAIKMLPKWNSYGRWPASGEMDIVEARGNMNYKGSNGVTKAVDSVQSSLHFGPSRQHDQTAKATVEKILTSSTFADKFHKFSVEWDEKRISFSVDDVEILKSEPNTGGFWDMGGLNSTGLTNPWHANVGGSTMAPFDQEFYLVLDVAVGGTTFFQDTWINFPYPKPWRDASDFVVRDFWQARHLWHPTWSPQINNGENAALQINYI
ncbi:Beta-1,3-glucan-binding protein [Mytilus coruscus]|uniref:Beta-1,3-glucan-binding protein n=1 Tax=Mytilus coruscus TaxID=42192 RepID=A0A6J8CZF9_MYTCO|nr:Beta-1,3-glucan-binding protein [Mytilus coruscus]